MVRTHTFAVSGRVSSIQRESEPTRGGEEGRSFVHAVYACTYTVCMHACMCACVEPWAGSRSREGCILLYPISGAMRRSLVSFFVLCVPARCGTTGVLYHGALCLARELAGDIHVSSAGQEWLDGCGSTLGCVWTDGVS